MYLKKSEELGKYNFANKKGKIYCANRNLDVDKQDKHSMTTMKLLFSFCVVYTTKYIKFS
jgi:hypothetical protein